VGLDGTGVLGVAVGQTDIPMHMGPTHMPRRTSAVGGDQDDWGQCGFAHGDPENTPNTPIRRQRTIASPPASAELTSSRNKEDKHTMKFMMKLPDWRPEINTGLLGWILILGWLVILALALPAEAQTSPQPNSTIRQACSSDVRTLCAAVVPGGGRIKECMLQKRDQLSQACKDGLTAAKGPPGPRT